MRMLRMPEVAGLDSATVVRWMVEPGQSFQSGQVLVRLESENAWVELVAGGAGSLAAVVAPVGRTVRAGQELAQVAAPGQVAPASAATAVTSSASSSAQAAAGRVLQKDQVVQEGQPMTTASGTGESIAILMPQAGNTMTEGTVVKWHVKEGDWVKVGQVICEIETDKATMDYESPYEGRIAKIVAREGQVVPVKTPIAYLGEAPAGQGPTAGAASVATVAETPSPSQLRAEVTLAAPAAGAGGLETAAPGRIKASPAAKKLAAERGVDLAAVGTGSGPGGRIVIKDVEKAAAAVQASPAVVAAQPVASPPPVRAAATPAEAGAGMTHVPLATQAVGQAAAEGRVVRRPMSKMRRAIGLNLQVSKQTIPHFYLKGTIDAQGLVDFYKAQKPTTGCTINDVVVLAVGRVMREFPAFRSRIEGEELVEFPEANIGIAVGVEEGLVVPVVLRVDRLSLVELAREARRVVDNARKGKLENIGKGVFTVSNLGMFGVEDFQAIINPPESGILAVSAVREDVLVRDGALRAGRVMNLTLSVDHRVVDGVMAARFMARLKEVLENPALFLV